MPASGGAGSCGVEALDGMNPTAMRKDRDPEARKGARPKSVLPLLWRYPRRLPDLVRRRRRTQVIVEPSQGFRPHLLRVDVSLTGVDEVLKIAVPAVEAIHRAHARLYRAYAVHRRAVIAVTGLEQDRPRRHQCDDSLRVEVAQNVWHKVTNINLEERLVP